MKAFACSLSSSAWLQNRSATFGKFTVSWKVWLISKLVNWSLVTDNLNPYYRLLDHLWEVCCHKEVLQGRPKLNDNLSFKGCDTFCLKVNIWWWKERMNHYVLFELVLLNEKRSRTNHVVFVIAGFCLWFWRTDGTGGGGQALNKGFLKKELD